MKRILQYQNVFSSSFQLETVIFRLLNSYFECGSLLIGERKREQRKKNEKLIGLGLDDSP